MTLIKSSVHVDKPYDELKVLELLAQGSEYAFTQLFDHHRPRIYSAALKFLKVQELAEEVVQEVFIKIWQKRTDLMHVRNFDAYLFSMTRNFVFDSIKKLAEETTAVQEFSLGQAHENGTERLLLSKEYEGLLDEAVEKLPPQQKQVFKLAKFEGLSHEVIAKRMSISRLTVKAHMKKALQFIRLQLQHHLNAVILALLIFF